MLRLKSRSIFVQWTLLHNARENVKKVLLEWVFAYQLQQTLGIDKFATVFQDRHSIFKGLNDSDASDCFSIVQQRSLNKNAPTFEPEHHLIELI